MFKNFLNPVASFGKKAANGAINVVKTAVAVVAIAVTVGSLASCDKNDGPSNSFDNRSTAAADYTQSSLPVVTVSGDITSNTTWSASNVYEINGIVTVRNGATLTINAGTYIKSTANTPGTPNGVLVVAKDGSINAVGTECNPIVFTSRYLLDGNNTTVGTPGDFGGIILLDDAQINDPAGTRLIEGLPDDPKFYYGSSSNANNAASLGQFRYVRIEYAGYELAPNIEVNGLTMGGVGSGTTINNVQVSWGLDDGFEWFGGTVNASNLVAYANDDDQFDFDLGYTGTLSNSVAIAKDCSTHSGGGTPDSNGAEIDNNPDDNCGAFPQTEVTFSNVSIWGTSSVANAGLYENGVHVRRGATLFVTNSTVTGYNRGIFVEASSGACEFAEVEDSSIHGFLSVGNYINLGGNTTSTANPAPWFPASYTACWVRFHDCN